LVRLVMELYIGSRSSVVAAGVNSDSFEITVGVHQGSALSPLLFNLVIEEATKDVRQGVPWDMLYADDLVLTATSREEVVARFALWKNAMERRGLKVNLQKTKLLVTGKERETVVESGQYPCGVCGRGVGVNSILCASCNKWVHKRCSRVQNINRIQNFECPACLRRRTREAPVSEDLVLGPGEDEVVGEVEEFCYLGDMVDRVGGVERAVRVRTAAAWSKWRDIAGLLCRRKIPLKHRAMIYEACVRSVLLYGMETWPMTQRVEACIQSCDRRMLRYMTGVSLRDRVPSEEVARRCGLPQVVDILRARRLRWFGHVQRRNGNEALAVVRDWEVEGRRPRGRPRKTWQKTVEEDLTKLGIDGAQARDRDVWRNIIARLTPRNGNN
jgi:hypothetical protein